MLIATVPYVGKRVHLDPDPDPKLNYGSGSEHANNFGSGSTTLQLAVCDACGRPQHIGNKKSKSRQRIRNGLNRKGCKILKLLGTFTNTDQFNYTNLN